MSKEIHETTVRLDSEMAYRLGVVAQVLGISRNALMKQAISESVITYEGDPDYQKKRKGWIKRLQSVGS